MTAGGDGDEVVVQSEQQAADRRTAGGEGDEVEVGGVGGGGWWPAPARGEWGWGGGRCRRGWGHGWCRGRGQLGALGGGEFKWIYYDASVIIRSIHASSIGC